MAITEELIAKFKADVTDFDRKINKVKKEIDTTSKKTTDFEKNTSRVANLISNHYKTIALSVGVTGGAIGAFAIKVGSDMQQAQKRIEAMLGSAKDAEKVIKTLRQAGQETGASVIGLANSFGKLATFVDNGTLSLKESLQISKGLSNTALALGAGTEQLNQVMFGLSQALGSGTVRAEEFNQVTEPLPGIINRMEESAGLASGELRRMINDGKVTSEMFKDLLIPAVQSFSVEAEKMASTLKAQQGILSNTLSAIGEDLFDYLEKPLSNIHENLNDILQGFLSIKRASDSELQTRLIELTEEKRNVQSRIGMPFVDTKASQERIASIVEEEQKIINELRNRLSEDTKSPVKVKITPKANRSTDRQLSNSNFNNVGLDITSTFRQEIESLKSITLEVENQSKSVADIMEGAFDTATTAITNSFVTMATQSGTSFKDMARSMIADINRIIMRAIVMRAVSGLVSNFTAPTAHTAVISNTYGVQGGAAGLQYGMSGLAGARASGGPVNSGMSYLVGERGPEILTMGNKGGFVTSNAQSGSMLNNSSQVINIDARGASAGVEQKIRQVVQEVTSLRKQVPTIAVSAVRDQNSRNPNFLR